MDLLGTSKLHYQITEKLGEGGMGVVYKATDRRLKRDVAIKFMPHHIAANDEMRARFQIEAQAVATLNHPNITTIFAIETLNEGQPNEEVFFVMEYIEGMELKQRIKEGNLPINETIGLALQIAEGLQAAHEKGITHRDIKPSNIMLTRKGRVKLMDFGLARIGTSPQITKPNATFGTVAYMSPEQARGKVVDHRSDIWSYGIMLYEMLAGQLPFDASHEQSLIYAIIHEEPHPIRERVQNIPPSLEAIIEKALKKDLSERYQDVKGIIEDLKSFNMKTRMDVDREPEATAPPPPVPKPRDMQPASPQPPSLQTEFHSPVDRVPVSPRKREGANWLVIAVGLLVLIGGGVWWFLKDKGLESPRDTFATELESPVSNDETNMPVTPEVTLPAEDQAVEDTETQPANPGSSTTEQSDNGSGNNAQSVDESVDAVSERDENPVSSPPTVANQPVQEPSQPEPATRATATPNRDAQRAEAMSKRTAMLEIRDRVPAGATETGIYQEAIESYQTGERLFSQQSFEQAGQSYDQARLGFQSAIEATIMAQRTLADEAMRAMNQAREALGNEAPDSPAVRDARDAEQKAQAAYEARDYNQARTLYQEATAGYEEFRRASAATAASESARSAQIASSVSMLQQAFAQEDIDILNTVVNLSNRERATYEAAFSAFSNFSLTITSERQVPLDDGGYRVEIQTELNYSNNKNQRESNAISFVAPLLQSNGGWTISKYNIQ